MVLTNLRIKEGYLTKEKTYMCNAYKQVTKPRRVYRTLQFSVPFMQVGSEVMRNGQRWTVAGGIKVVNACNTTVV